MAKIFSIVGICVGLLLIIMGIATAVPDDIIQTGVLDRNNRDRGGYQRYVGGDAYNFMIEASIRGGEIAGATTSRAIYLSSGAIIFSGSFIALGVFLDKEKRIRELESFSANCESASSGTGENT